MQFLYLFIGVAGGMCFTVQSGINAQLSATWAHNPVLASTVSFALGALALYACVLALRIPMPPLRIGQLRWWHGTGGILGAYVVFAGTLLAPLLGAGMLVALMLAGQLGAALVLDQYGLIGFKKKALNAQRLLGLALVALGVVLVRFF